MPVSKKEDDLGMYIIDVDIGVCGSCVLESILAQRQRKVHVNKRLYQSEPCIFQSYFCIFYTS